MVLQPGCETQDSAAEGGFVKVKDCASVKDFASPRRSGTEASRGTGRPDVHSRPSGCVKQRPNIWALSNTWGEAIASRLEANALRLESKAIAINKEKEERSNIVCY